MEKYFSSQAADLIRNLSKEDRPFHKETLWRYVHEPAAKEILVISDDKIVITLEAMLAVFRLIREAQNRSRRHLQLVFSSKE